MSTVNRYRTEQLDNMDAIFKDAKAIVPGAVLTNPQNEWNSIGEGTLAEAKTKQKDIVKRLYNAALNAALDGSTDSAKEAVKAAMQKLIDRAVNRIDFEYTDIIDRNDKILDKNLQKLSTAISQIQANKHNLQSELKNSKSALFKALDEPTSVFKFRMSKVLREIASAFKKIPASTDTPVKENDEKNNDNNTRRP